MVPRLPRPPNDNDSTCADCGKPLGQRIDYVRRLRPGQQLPPLGIERDPLCKPCWEADTQRVEAAIARAKGEQS